MYPRSMTVTAVVCCLGSAVAAADFSKLPANTWTLIHSEDASGGKTFATAVLADNVDRIYLWGTGGTKPARNVYLRYELESLCPADPKWQAALPRGRRGRWTAEKFPPFRIYGQGGPDGLKYHEGPRLQCVGGYNHTNRIRWWDFGGGLATNPSGAAPTWIYDCAANAWRRPKLDVQPPPRCNAPIVYDPANKLMVLFGGYNQSAALNDTWVYRCAEGRWRRREDPRLRPRRVEGQAASPGEHLSRQGNVGL